MKSNIIIILLFIATLYADANEHIDRINKELMAGRLPDALELFNDALTKYDANASLYFLGATISIKLDDLDQANKYYIKAIEFDPKNKEYRNAQQELLDFKNALTAARKTFDSGLLDEAILEYEKLTKKYTDHSIVFYNLGLIYKASENHDLAVKNYQKAHELNSYEDKYSKAIKAIAQMSTMQGDEEYRRQEFDEAIESYHRSIDYDPSYTVAIFKLARTYYKLRDLDNAEILLIEGLKINGEQEQSEKMLADIFRKRGQPEEAILHYKKAISINGNYYQAYYSLGSLYLSEGELIKAQQALKSALLLNSTYAKAYGALGAVEQMLGNIIESIKNYKKAVELDSKSYDNHYRLSSIYNINKQYEDAKKAAKESLNIKRNYAPAHFELGIAEKSLGNKVAAIASFEKAKKDRKWRESAEYEIDLLSKGL